jgi:hypothetical protein
VQIGEKHGRDLFEQRDLSLPAHEKRVEEIVVHLQTGALVLKSVQYFLRLIHHFPRHPRSGRTYRAAPARLGPRARIAVAGKAADSGCVGKVEIPRVIGSLGWRRNSV